MKSDFENFSKNLASYLLKYRQTQGLTQTQLAEKCSLTRALVTQIESGGSNPTLETLLKISHSLGISVEEMIKAPDEMFVVYRNEDIPLDRRKKDGVTVRKLSSNSNSNLSLEEVTLAPHAQFKGSPHRAGTFELSYCAEGELTLSFAHNQGAKLKSGDFIHFPGNQAHTYSNRGKVPLRFISLVSFGPLTS